MRTVSRLRLRYLLLASTPDVLPRSVAHHVETSHPHQNILHNMLWWRWWESHPRPQCLPYGGITTILLKLKRFVP